MLNKLYIKKKHGRMMGQISSDLTLL